MPTKTFDAQDALMAALTALKATTLTGWTVDFGLPPRRDERHLWVDEQITEWVCEDLTTGLQSTQETFKLHAYVYVKKSGATALEVRDEVKTGGGAVESVLSSDPLLGGVVMLAQIVGGDVDSAFADPEGRAREVVEHLIIECSTFIG